MTGGSDAEEIARLKSTMMMRSFFVMFREIVDPAKIAPVLLDHYRWIIGLEQQGKVFASGPLFAAEGGPGVGMTIWRAADADEATALAAGDPFVLCGAATFTIKRWQINEGRIGVSIDFSNQTFHFD